jgi:hypothetical protein
MAVLALETATTQHHRWLLGREVVYDFVASEVSILLGVAVSAALLQSMMILLVMMMLDSHQFLSPLQLSPEPSSPSQLKTNDWRVEK